MTSDGRLFDLEPVVQRHTTTGPGGPVVGVVVEVSRVERVLWYTVPKRFVGRIDIGAQVRVPLGGRRVDGWVVDVDVDVGRPGGRGGDLKEIARFRSLGPPADIVNLCQWVAHHWVGRLPQLLASASPQRAVAAVAPVRAERPVAPRSGASAAPWLGAWRERPVTIARLPPAAPFGEVLSAAVESGDVLVVCPSLHLVGAVLADLRRLGVRAVRHPDGWAAAAAGATVVGSRTAVFAPMPRLGAIVVVDEHDVRLQNEGSPTWNAREVAIERGRRCGVPVLLTSATPSLEALAAGELRTPGRTAERTGWATVRVADRRDDDIGRSGLLSETFAEALRSSRRVLCVLNRMGRASMLGCRTCGSMLCCDLCEGWVTLDDAGLDTGTSRLRCHRCEAERPVVCQSCGSTAVRSLRLGVDGAASSIEALARRSVGTVTRQGIVGVGRQVLLTPGHRIRLGVGDCPEVLVGTEALLHRVAEADLVAFLEFDQELLGAQYRSTERALSLLADASRLVGGRSGTVLVQTRLPNHEVVQAALRSDPALTSAPEAKRRALLGFPPAQSLAVVGGAGGPEFMRRLLPILESESGVTVDQRRDGEWLVRSRDRELLVALLGRVERPAPALRLWLDPIRLPR